MQLQTKEGEKERVSLQTEHKKQLEILKEDFDRILQDKQDDYNLMMSNYSRELNQLQIQSTEEKESFLGEVRRVQLDYENQLEELRQSLQRQYEDKKQQFLQQNDQMLQQQTVLHQLEVQKLENHYQAQTKDFLQQQDSLNKALSDFKMKLQLTDSLLVQSRYAPARKLARSEMR